MTNQQVQRQARGRVVPFPIRPIQLQQRPVNAAQMRSEVLTRLRTAPRRTIYFGGNPDE